MTSLIFFLGKARRLYLSSLPFEANTLEGYIIVRWSHNFYALFKPAPATRLTIVVNSINKMTAPDSHSTNSEASKEFYDEQAQNAGSHELFQPSTNVSRILHSGDGNEFVTIGNQKFYKHELMQAFGGTLNPGLSAPPTHLFANPSPLGLVSFSVCTLVLSLYNARAMGIKTPNVVVALACFYGGVCQFLSGVWEMAIGNTFAATALTSYGAFWFLYAAMNIESFGVLAAYAEHPEQAPNAIGFFVMGWTIFTFMLFMCTLKSTIGMAAMFGCLTMTFTLLTASEFTGNFGVARAGAVFGILTSTFGFYNAFAGIATKTNSYCTVRQFQLTRGLK